MRLTLRPLGTLQDFHSRHLPTGERRTAEVWEQSRAALREASSCLIAKGMSITGGSSNRRVWNISYVSRESENYLSRIWPWELKTEATASLAAESGLCRRSSARPAPPVAAVAPALTDPRPPEARRAAESRELRLATRTPPGRPAAGRSSGTGRKPRPPARPAGARPGPARWAERFKLAAGDRRRRGCREAARRRSAVSGTGPRLPALGCRFPQAPWAGRRSRSAGTANSCRRRSATTAGRSSRSSAATRMPRAGAGARTAWLVRPGEVRRLRQELRPPPLGPRGAGARRSRWSEAGGAAPGGLVGDAAGTPGGRGAEAEPLSARTGADCRLRCGYPCP